MMFAAYVLLTLAALILAGAMSPARGKTLWLALLALGWGVGQFNTIIEAVAFSVMPAGDAAIHLLIALVAVALLCATAVTATGRWRGGSPEPVRPDLSLRSLAGVVIGYQLLYWVAGMFVWPFVADFYADKSLPSVALVAALQVPRALIFLAASWLWLRTGPRHAPLVLGIVFAVIAGMAPMFPDNPYMAADVRLAHGVETSVSNFLFGLLLGWLVRPKSSAQ